ncbi:MAG: hypothetical protein JSR77_07010 [Planctomycetes bacterium]|nr:hypothetical protein [Planctomycetota bacterium]
MNRLLNVVGGVLLAFALDGCGGSFLHSAAGTSEAVWDPVIVGEWAAAGTTVTRAVVSELSPGQYSVVLTVHHQGEFKTALKLDLVLTQIGTGRYADLFLSRSERDRLVGQYGFLVVPVHQIMKVSHDEDALRVWMFDAAWLERAADAGKFTHDRVTLGGGEASVITESTEQLRELISHKGEDPTAFGPPIVFHRMRQ